MKLTDILYEAVINERVIQTNDELRNEILKYNSVKELFDKKPSLYHAARRRGPEFFNDVTKHFKDERRKTSIYDNYTDEQISDLISNYISLKELRKENPELYEFLKRKGKDYYNQVTKNLEKQKKYTDDELEKIAKKYQHKMDWMNNHSGSYKTAYRKGEEFFDRVTSHMIPLGNKENKMVYTYEFFDKDNKPVAAYVGLTSHEERRKKEHQYQTNTSISGVKKFIKDHPELKYVYKNVSNGYIPYMEAGKLECEYESKYKNEKNEDGTNKWVVLNKLKCGGQGGFNKKFTEDVVKNLLKGYDNISTFRIERPRLYKTLAARPNNYLYNLTKDWKVPFKQYKK